MTLPPHLAYGQSGNEKNGIPPNVWVEFGELRSTCTFTNLCDFAYRSFADIAVVNIDKNVSPKNGEAVVW